MSDEPVKQQLRDAGVAEGDLDDALDLRAPAAQHGVRWTTLLALAAQYGPRVFEIAKRLLEDLRQGPQSQQPPPQGK